MRVHNWFKLTVGIAVSVCAVGILLSEQSRSLPPRERWSSVGFYTFFALANLAGAFDPLGDVEILLYCPALACGILSRIWAKKEPQIPA